MDDDPPVVIVPFYVIPWDKPLALRLHTARVLLSSWTDACQRISFCPRFLPSMSLCRRVMTHFRADVITVSRILTTDWSTCCRQRAGLSRARMTSFGRKIFWLPFTVVLVWLQLNNYLNIFAEICMPFNLFPLANYISLTLSLYSTGLWLPLWTWMSLMKL